MALTDILEKIEKKAEAEVKELQSEFDKKKKEYEKEAAAKQKELEKMMQSKIELDSAKVQERARIEAEMEAKNELLKAKRELIDDALAKAVEELASAGNYEEILVEMLKKVEMEGAEIVPAKGREDVTRSAIGKAQKNFSLSGSSTDIKGGFILRTEKIEIDNSFETIVNEQLRPTLEIELHKLLFA